MRMPGFTAEHALSETSMKLAAARLQALATTARRNVVVPQQYCYAVGSYICCCYYGFCWCTRRGPLPQ